jgi:hypothetical protein
VPDEIVVVTVVDVAVEGAAVIVVVVVEVVVGFSSCKRGAVNVVVVGIDSVVDVVETSVVGVIIEGKGPGDKGLCKLDPPEINIMPNIKLINNNMSSHFFIVFIRLSKC